MRISGSLVLATAFLTCTAALAIDQPIAGSKLQLKHSATKESLTFLSKDAAFLFPAIGGLDDPQTVGALLELVPSAGSAVSFTMPAGPGKPGWSAKAGTSARLRFDNALAPGGISPIRVTLLKLGKQIKITGRSLGGLTIAPATTSMTLRLTIGTQRNCVRFGPSTVRRADLSTFLALDAPASALPDCSDASIGLPSGCASSTFPTCGGSCPGDGVCTGGLGNCFCVSPSAPCGGTAPMCNGTCGAGETCRKIGVDLGECVCLPDAATPCGSPGAPTCGGACPSGDVCRPLYGIPILGGELGCTCRAPLPCGTPGGIECGNGFACGAVGGVATCLPILCGTFPTCGNGPCGDGGECRAVTVGGSSGCICAVPGACCVDGYACPGSDVCTITAGPSSCGCE